jgi:transcriptional regulator with GAF, ATPase, and Fis domain
LSDLTWYPLRCDTGCVGVLAVPPTTPPEAIPSQVFERLAPLLAVAVNRLAERINSERQIAHLNTYLTVSSMLAQSMGLHEILETALYCCLDVSSATEASILLLDEEKKNFRFYQVAGSAQPLLTGAKFPADVGIAGAVMRSRRSEVINDVQNDPRFYGKVDVDSGSKTRNLIAMPLVAGEEPIGVMEVLNKAGGDSFTEWERLQLLSIAEEIGFAIRNAKVFEYVVNSYCKQRQGQASCKGCKRPLGSWTPCVKYREASL